MPDQSRRSFRALPTAHQSALSLRRAPSPGVVGARPPSGDAPPRTEEAKRRQALMRIAAPGGSPCGKARPFSGREQPAHNADRRAYRRFAAAVSLDPETAFWKRTGAADRRNALDSAGFPRVHPLPPARCRTDPRSWAGQCLPRPPEMSLRGSSAGATSHSANKRHRLAPSVEQGSPIEHHR